MSFKNPLQESYLQNFWSPLFQSRQLQVLMIPSNHQSHFRPHSPNFRIMITLLNLLHAEIAIVSVMIFLTLSCFKSQKKGSKDSLSFKDKRLKLLKV